MGCMDIDRAQEIYDRQLPEEDILCARCEEVEAEDGEYYCEYCMDILSKRDSTND